MSFHTRCILFGGALGGALTWLSVSRKGKEARGLMKNHGDKLLADLSELVRDGEMWEKMTDGVYTETIERALLGYAKKVGLTTEAVERIRKMFADHQRLFKKEMAKRAKQSSRRR